jgi:hypothetical protein
MAIVRYERSPGDRLTRSPEGKPQAGCRIKDQDIDFSEVPELTENGSHQIQFALWTPTKFHPQIVVANRVVLLRPVAVFPSDHPLRNSLPCLNVLGISGDFYFARLLECEEALDRRHQFHSTVCCVRIAPDALLLHRSEAQDAGPPSRTGIAQARSIGNQRNLLHRPLRLAGLLARAPFVGLVVAFFGRFEAYSRRLCGARQRRQCEKAFRRFRHPV